MAVSNHPFLVRLVSALLLAPLCLWVFLSGGWPFYLLVALIYTLSLYEALSLSIKLEKGTKSLLYFVLISIYITVCTLSFLLLPPYFNLLLLLGIWASDIGGYFAGKTFGRRVIFPRISPNKTGAGFMGAALLPAAVMLVMSLFFIYWYKLSTSGFCLLPAGNLFHTEIALNPFSFFHPALIFALFFFVGLAGQGGDLLISLIKRKAGVKDTGKLIPGHGGILDRVDSLLLASVVFYLAITCLKAVSC